MVPEYINLIISLSMKVIKVFLIVGICLTGVLYAGLDYANFAKGDHIESIHDFQNNQHIKNLSGDYLDEIFFKAHGIIGSNKSDMRIEMHSDGETITLFYDAENEAIKMFYPKENQTLYADGEGYYYIQAEGQGWMKTKMKSMMGSINQMIPIDPSFLSSFPDRGTHMHKISYFAFEITVSKLENSSDVKRVNSSQDGKTIFLAKNRVTITFDKTQRLESLKEGDAFIHYFYESQNISFPNAKSIELPF